jgi:hypothetical protein
MFAVTWESDTTGKLRDLVEIIERKTKEFANDFLLQILSRLFVRLCALWTGGMEVGSSIMSTDRLTRETTPLDEATISNM